MSEEFKCSTEAVPGPCAECGANEVCALINDKPLCYDCWNRARETQQAYMAVRIDPPEWVAKYGRYFAGIPLLKEEAEAFAREMERRSQREGHRFEIAPVAWNGERLAHPGYMARRRAAVLAM